MATRRIYRKFHPSSDIILDGDDAHYASRVLRLKNGDEIRVFNESCGEWLCNVISIKPMILKPSRLLRSYVESRTRLEVCFSPIKSCAASDIVADMTELGVQIIRPFIATRTVVRSVNIQKMKASAIASARQCERLDVPTIHDICNFDELLHYIANNLQKCVLFCNEIEKSLHIVDELIKCDMASYKGVMLIIGPEGGFCDAEREALLAIKNVKSVSLSKNILRSETAIMTATSIALSFL